MQPRLKAYVSLVKAIAFSKAGKLSEAEASYRSGITELRESDPQHPLLKEAYGQYAQFLRGIGRFTDANAQQRFSDKITGTQDVPDRQLR
jgi:hypothetical protein